MKNFDKFILALNGKQKINVNFKVDPTSALISRKCIPVDYYKYKRQGDNEEGYAYRVWDCQDKNMTTLSLKDFEIKDIELLNEKFSSNHFKNLGHSEIKAVYSMAILSLFAALLVFVLMLYVGF